MSTFATFRDYVDAVRGRTKNEESLTAFAAAAYNQKTAAAPEIPKEGITSVFPGHHVYAMLLLRPSFTTSAENADRKKHMEIIAGLAQGVRSIVHNFDGALLEVQGPVAHAFIPNEDGTENDVIAASLAIQEFIRRKVRPSAGDGFIKGLVAYCHGPTIFVASEDAHGDNSIVSLAPAANAPAKALWKGRDDLSDGAILAVKRDGTSRQIDKEKALLLAEEGESVLFANSSRAPVRFKTVEAKAVDVPAPEAPDSPTVEEPLKAYAVSFRADMDGFTRRVAEAFEKGKAEIDAMAQEFLGIMRHAKSFCTHKGCVHLPWAGDCFNLLLAFDEKAEYQAARKRRILEIGREFVAHMKSKFPKIDWAFAHAGGDLENAQICNTLVSRITVGRSSLLIATGLPVEHTLKGQINESPRAGHGVLWKEDATSLDDDLREVLLPCSGGNNYRHFSMSDVSQAMDKHDFLPLPSAYVSTPGKTAASAIVAPVVRPYAL
jgi:hypothetical protein